MKSNYLFSKILDFELDTMTELLAAFLIGRVWRLNVERRMDETFGEERIMIVH